MAYINTETLEYPLYDGDIKILHPNFDGIPNVYAFVTPVKEPLLDYTKNFYEKLPKNVDGVWYQVWEIKDATEEQIASRKEKLNYYQNNFFEVINKEQK